MAELFDTPPVSVSRAYLEALRSDLRTNEEILDELAEEVRILQNAREVDHEILNDVTEQRDQALKDVAFWKAQHASVVKSNDGIWENFLELKKFLEAAEARAAEATEARDNEAKQVEFITEERDQLVELNAKLDAVLNEVIAERNKLADQLTQALGDLCVALDERNDMEDQRDAALFTTDRLIAGIDEVIERV